ncbi:MAG TPA: glycoside hydrolase family 5 protein, partial [Polyangiaceae bacterium]|nr:glycoside hydrolase family 5 protein [Polyangiaceae bacterium]
MKTTPSPSVVSFVLLCVGAGCAAGQDPGEFDADGAGGAVASGGLTGSSGGAGGDQASGGGPAAGGSVSVSSGGGPTGSGGGPLGTGGGDGTMTAAELVDSWGLGWNLGNSLDVPEGETEWGNPEVSASLLEGVAAAGFDVVRIPVTWSLHTGPGPDYLIDEAWLSRVAQVVDYVRQANMSAIINVHHDGADELEGVEWLTLNDVDGNITTQNNQAVEARFVRIWTQIAQYFADYDGGLLFESMNEIHDGYDAPDPQYYSIINHLNQIFVDLVRTSGGHNAERHLVVPGYNTNIDYTVAGFEAPVDVAPDHLILSVHFYDPYTFTIEGSTMTWGAQSPGTDTWGQEDYVVEQFDKLRATFVDAGLPMIVGEYGTSHLAGYEDYRRYYMEYVTKAAIDRK